jgi:hypothetical protein
MGVDCKIMLPDNVRVKDVAKVIGIAAGLLPKWDGSHGAKWVEVPGADVKTTSIPEMAVINLDGGHLIDGESKHFVFYHFESSRGGRLMGPRSTAFWLAVAHRLVDFFGGVIDYQDCDSQYCDYGSAANTREENSPEDDEEWVRFQERLFNVKPITKDELLHYNELAAYKMEE